MMCLSFGLNYFIGITKSAEYFVYFMQIGQMEEGRGGPTKKHLIYVSDSLFDMKLTYIYMLLYMQAPSEAPMREEHQTGGPPLTSQ